MYEVGYYSHDKNDRYFVVSVQKFDIISAEKGETNTAFESEEVSKGVKGKVIGFIKSITKSTPENHAEADSKPKKKPFIDRLVDDKCGDKCCFSSNCLRIFKVVFQFFLWISSCKLFFWCL